MAFFSYGAAQISLVERAPSPRQTKLQVGFLLHSFDYQEELPAPAKSTERGTFPGFTLGYLSESSESPWFFSSNLNVSMAKTLYDGALMLANGRTTPSTTTTDNLWLDLKGLAGLRVLRFSERANLRAYTGLGIHYWNRHILGVGEVIERYNWLYLPVGVAFETELSRAFGLSLLAEMRVPFAGSVQAELGGNGGPTIDLSLGSRLGAYTALQLRFLTSDHFAVLLTPWFEYTEIGRGPLSGVGFFEPASSNLVWGTMLTGQWTLH